MNTYRKIVLTTLVLIIIIFISSCSVSFRRSNRASGDVQGSGSSDSLTVDPPIFNPAGGSVKRGIGVSIMSATEGAQVYYNIGDGTQADPSPGIDLLYDESNKPVITHNNMVIKAKSFKTGYTPSNVVSYNYALTPQIFVGGAFTTYGNIYNKLVRVNSDGTLDSSFNPGTGATGPNDNIRSILIQSNGKILVNGYFQSFNGVVHHGLVRLNSDGSLDTSFDPNFITETDSITMQNDGKILVAGVFKNPDDTSYHGIIRLNTDGSLDTSFNSDRYKIANPILMAGMVIIQPDGEILAIENFVSGGTPHGHVVRLNNDGTLDPSFNENDFNFYIDKISLQDDGNTIVTGVFSTCNGVNRNGIARLTTVGDLDTNFNPDLSIHNGSPTVPLIQSITIQPNTGKIFLGGLISTDHGATNRSMIVLNTDGSVDNSFDHTITYLVSSVGQVVSIIFQNDNKILITGFFTSYDGTSCNRMARLNSDGSIDTSFSAASGAIYVFLTTATQSDGKILLGGQFTSYNPIIRNGTALLNMDGTLDNDFANGSGADSSVVATVIQDDGKILVAGGFTHYNGIYRNRIARLNIDGTLDTSFDPGEGVSQYVSSNIETIAIQKDGKILIGITNAWAYNGTTFSGGIVRLNSNGSVDNSFSTVTGFYGVYAITIQNDGKILIGGTPSGTHLGKIVRLNTDGTPDTSFDSGVSANSDIAAIAIQANGKILVGGLFNRYNDIAYGEIVRLNSDGSVDQSFNIGGSGAFFHQYVAGEIRTITLTEDGKIFIGGMFSYYNGVARQSIAKLNSDGSLDTSFVPDTESNADGYDTICSISVQKDGKLLVGGDFTKLNATERVFLGRLNSDGSVDTSFSPNIRDGLDSVVFSILMLNN